MAPPKPAAGGGGGGEGQGQPGPGQVINLSLLDLNQLQGLKGQVEQELNFYQDAIIQLKDVQVKMNESQNCLKKLNPEKTELLVPVTGSVSSFKILNFVRFVETKLYCCSACLCRCSYEGNSWIWTKYSSTSAPATMSKRYVTND
jgi:hypothetical protein